MSLESLKTILPHEGDKEHEKGERKRDVTHSPLEEKSSLVVFPPGDIQLPGNSRANVYVGGG